jgi:hypothetical protein
MLAPVGLWRHLVGLVAGSAKLSERELRQATPQVDPPKFLGDCGPETPDGYGPAIWTARMGGAAWECSSTIERRTLTWTERGWR